MVTGMQLNLFDVGHPPRPRIYDDEVLETTLDSILPRVIKWLRSENDWSSFEDIKRDLRDAIEFEDDSRKIVNYLESHYYWMVDRDLQEIMDEVVEYRYSALTDLTNRWVLRNGVSPKYSESQRATFKKDGKMYEGEIVKVDSSTAKYLVYCSDLGHTRNGIGTHGIYLPFEEVSAIP